MLNNKSILITGGTGSFGQRFAETVLKKFNPKKVIIYSRDELKQFDMQNKFASNKKFKKLRFFIGDVRDLPRLNLAMNKVDYVIHAAALKQVQTAEYNPFEAIKTNIIGAQNVIDASLTNNVKKVLALSTDKAAAPINLYGATKLVSDKLFSSANSISGGNNILFSAVRYGNVMYSRGSVVPHFLKCKKNGYLPITHEDMTRFHISLDQGVEFVLNCLKIMVGGELFIPKIPSIKIVDLAKAIAPKIKPTITGVRPGEKLHEEMITETDSMNTYEFKKYYVIFTDYNYVAANKKNFFKQLKRLKGKICKKNFSYNSKNNENFLSTKDLEIILKRESK